MLASGQRWLTPRKRLTASAPNPKTLARAGTMSLYAIDVGKRYMTTTRRTHLPSICNTTEEIKTNADGTGCASRR